MKAKHVITIIFVCALAACTTRHDPRVKAAFSLADSAPEAALDSIAALDSLVLPSTDRMLLRLAAIKAADKADMPLPGDTAILPLMDYYSSHETDRFYPTALYYAGRVYSESGDYPTALSYFQDALDELNKNTQDLKLKSCVLAQLAGNLGRLHLIDEAAQYYKEAIKCDSIRKDTVNLIYDFADFAENLRWADKYEEALPYLNRAVEIALEKNSDYLPTLNLFIARIKIKQEDIKGARNLIHPILENIDNVYRIDAMSTAIKAYYMDGIYDSAFTIAEQVIELNPNDNAKRLAYYYLIQDELQNFSPKDSVREFHKKYLELTEKILKKYTDQSSILQTSLYNYSLHDRDREKAVKTQENTFHLLLFVIAVVALLLIILLLVKNRSKTNLIKLHEALDYIQQQQLQIESFKADENTTAAKGNGSTSKDEDIRKQLRQKYIEMQLPKTDICIIPESIACSPGYITLRNKAAKGEGVPESDKTWNTFEKKFNKTFPKFRFILEQLSGKHIKPHEYITLMLIRCGFKPAEIATLIFRSKSTISSRRVELSRKLFGEDIEATLFYRIIHNI